MSRKLRLVIDTNIIISGLWGGKPGEIIDLWKHGHIYLLISPDILKEYLAVLSRFVSASKDLEEWAKVLTQPDHSEWIVPTKTIHVIKEDPSDDRFLECAVEGKADFLVSGDKHLLKLKFYKDIPIFSARQFLENKQTHI